MTSGLIKMWFSFFAMLLLVVAVGTLALSRSRLKGFWKGLMASFAYVCVVVAGFIIILVIFSGPGG